MAEIRLFDIQKDYVFKRVFGQEKSKKSLISLLNAILNGNPAIDDITLINTEIPRAFEENKDIRLDVRAEIGKGRFVHIEIQSKDTGEIPERALQNLSNMMAENTQSGTPESRSKEALKNDLKSYKYPKVIGIWILGENVTDRKGAIHESYMTYQKTSVDDYQIMTDKSRIIFIELRKAHPKNLTRKNMLDMWLAFLKNPLATRNAEPVKEVEEAFRTLEYLSSDSEFRATVRYIEAARKEHAVQERIAVEKARKEAKEEGKAEGANDKAIEVAKKMLLDGISIDVIAKYSSLTIEEVEKLR